MSEQGKRRFDDQVAIVTGGSNGIGRAITCALVDQGASVLVVDLVNSGYFDGEPQVFTVTGDVGEQGLAGAVVAAAARRFGPVSILVNDAASYPDGALLDMTPQAWDRVFAVNVTGSFMMMQAFARHRVRAGGGGAIVNISTGSARSPRPGGAAYAASKAAVEVMSKVFAMELGEHGIRVNVVAPGYIDVRGWSDAYPDRAPDALRQALVEAIPLAVNGERRAGHPADIANAVMFLASADAAHVTGTVLDVDGGSGAGRFTLLSPLPAENANARG
ncbi:MAG TPA: SDR family oxidoreductase [Streptosporangiaceae bacterium]|nr:SDR family oxidoreductase [Streptosporangiaceae bacterium]